MKLLGVLVRGQGVNCLDTSVISNVLLATSLVLNDFHPQQHGVASPPTVIALCPVPVMEKFGDYAKAFTAFDTFSCDLVEHACGIQC